MMLWIGITAVQVQAEILMYGQTLLKLSSDDVHKDLLGCLINTFHDRIASSILQCEKIIATFSCSLLQLGSHFKGAVEGCFTESTVK
jgi:hypothetical protein